jgi:hypothetical protein
MILTRNTIQPLAASENGAACQCPLRSGTGPKQGHAVTKALSE